MKLYSTNRALLIVITLAALSACHRDIAPALEPSEAWPGGNGSVAYKPFASFELPASNLPPSERPHFHAGKALAHQPWVKAPTITTARDGLGPIYNARTCLGCHINGGRSKVPAAGQEMFGPLLRLSIPGADSKLGSVPEPSYGDQLQTQSTSLSHQLRHRVKPSELPQHEVQPEAYVKVHWQDHQTRYPDGTVVTLRKPRIELTQLGYGAMHPDTLFSLRNAPPLHGTGLLALIPQPLLALKTDPEDTNGDGISGRFNWVWNHVTQQHTIGRFGLKANRPDIENTTAGAFRGDIGISNWLFPDQPCTDQQTRCNQEIDGNDEGVELPKHLLDLAVDFTANIGVPKQRPLTDTALNGREYFYRADCHQCHTPQQRTETSTRYPHLSNQIIWPYTDMLLHDMGRELADGRPDFEASGSEWRTPPLWGLGLTKQVNGSQFFLHDGRARTIEEAILWHGGEAAQSREKFQQLPASQRAALIEFLRAI